MLKHVKIPPLIAKFPVSRHIRFMAQSSVNSTQKKLIQIDVSSDTVCPWCYVGKRNLDKAMDLSKDQYDFEVRWHPFILNPHAPKEGITKDEFYKQKFGSRSEQMKHQMKEVYGSLGMDYDLAGLYGNSMDSHRIITFAGKQGFDKQNALVEELFFNYFTEGKFIGDWHVLVDAARKVGVEGAAEFLEDPNNGAKEVYEELEKHSANISGVPHFAINDKYQLSGGQQPEVFLRAFKAAAN